MLGVPYRNFFISLGLQTSFTGVVPLKSCWAANGSPGANLELEDDVAHKNPPDEET